MIENQQPVYSPRVPQALAFAADVHSQQRRKGKEEPYLSHVLMVAALVTHFGGDEDQIIAASLHDAVEDQGGREMAARIRELFGDRVTEIVLECSDSVTARGEKKMPWRERKEIYLASLAEPDLYGARIVEACDKLANLRDIVEDLRTLGPATLDRFSGGPDGVRWYYEELGRVLVSGFPQIEDEYGFLLSQLLES